MKNGTKIEEVGKWDMNADAARFHHFTDHIDVNTADIFSELIKEAGRVCEHYASDVLYLIEQVRRMADQSVTNFDDTNREHPVGTVTWIGFRKMGVNFFTLDNDTDTDGRVDEWRDNREYFTKFILSAHFKRDGEFKMVLFRHD